MIGWMRRVLSPRWIVIGTGLYVFMISPVLFGWWLQWKQQFEDPELLANSQKGGIIALFLMGMAYGAYRVIAFHPVFRTKYRTWLEQTPWRAGKPLLLGPVHLVWQDAIPVGVLLLLAFRHPELHPLRVPLAFLLTYLLCLAVSFWPSGEKHFGYGLLFGMGMVAHWWKEVPIALGLAALVYLVALVGLRRAMGRFPWNLERFLEAFPLEISQEKKFQRMLGWPFDHLRAEATTASGRISYRDGVLISLLVGWSVYVLGSLIENPIDREWALFRVVFVSSVILFIVRFFIYCVGYLPPISLWGRFRTLRWIVPGYDKVFVAPLCIVLIGRVSFLLLEYDCPLDVASPVVTSFTFLVALNLGPTLESWRLTGAHRVVPAAMQSSGQFLKVG